MQWVIRHYDKSAVLGVIVAAMGCASCFPALGALAASFGLGFLAQFEGLFINTLLPVFAWIALIANTISFLSHLRWIRLVSGIAGPVMVLLTLYPLWTYGWSTYLFYTGLVIMFSVAIWDIVLPAKKRCTVTKSGQSMS